MPATIRAASPDDAAALTNFAAASFRETFGPDNAPEDMNAYVADAFTLDRQRVTLADPRAFVLVAEDETGIAGYAQLRDGPAPPEVLGARAIELERFYVASRWQGGGLAARLMDAVLGAARARCARAVWLGVWERNARAIRFYARMGFEPVGSHIFMLGTDAQTDLIMTRALGPAE